MTEPKNAIVKQYKELLSMDGVELEFEDMALKKIAELAIKRGTGARRCSRYEGCRKGCGYKTMYRRKDRCINLWCKK